MSKKTKGPQFLRFVEPLVVTLRELGSSGVPAEIADRVFERMHLTEAEQAETTSNGQSRVRNQIGWARFYLAKAGLIDASQRGLWTLTAVGREAKLDPDSVLALFKSVQKQFPRKPHNATTDLPSADDADDEAETPEEDGYKSQLVAVLRALPPAGFERICQRLLRESGFQQVVVTGKSGDGGIDGHGVLAINQLVTFRVLFQCKRYGEGNPVTPSQVRDFRGAMQGRAEKGLILTTGSFTSEARKEATRDGVPPIELVDAEKLVSMFESVRLGLRPVQTFEVDDGFFDEFRR